MAVVSPGVGSGPFVPSSATVARLAMPVTPAGNGETTVTAKIAVPDAPAARSPTASVHEPVAQDHLTSEAPASKVELAGTVSMRTTPVAAWVPALPYDRVYATVDPGVAV